MGLEPMNTRSAGGRVCRFATDPTDSTGFEPATSSLEGWHSIQTELRVQIKLKQLYYL
jgi:hypothetical protein